MDKIKGICENNINTAEWDNEYNFGKTVKGWKNLTKLRIKFVLILKKIYGTLQKQKLEKLWETHTCVNSKKNVLKF